MSDWLLSLTRHQEQTPIFENLQRNYLFSLKKKLSVLAALRFLANWIWEDKLRQLIQKNDSKQMYFGRT